MSKLTPKIQAGLTTILQNFVNGIKPTIEEQSQTLSDVLTIPLDQIKITEDADGKRFVQILDQKTQTFKDFDLFAEGSLKYFS